VAETQYPREQMHRIAYTKLTQGQIDDKLRAAADGPASASALSDALAGQQLRILTDDGPELRYRFRDANRLSLQEDGAAAVDSGYGALDIGQVVFVSHMLPGTQRGYHLVIDRDTNLVTVFEVWFSGYEDNREVQRQAWFGYVEQPGQPAPETRHRLTNRVEGKGYFWKQDTGAETLEFFPSTIYSNFVELSRFGGELGFCAPSDYIQVNDEVYIYQRTECEFSGTQTVYVFDVNRVEQIGARLGFDENDALEYYVFRGTGEWLGQLAQFERFGDIGDSLQNGPDEKGARRVYRPMDTFRTFTRSEFDRIAAETEPTVFPEGRGGMSGNKQEVSGYLVGRQMTVRYDDGPVLEYRFDEIQSLRWRKQGQSSWITARYEAWESAPDLVLFAHLLEGEPDHDCHVVAADFAHGLASCLHGTMGSEYIGNEAQVENLFGVIEAEGLTPPKYRRHRFTDELLGKALTWNYDRESGLTSMHLYTTPHSLSWIIFGQDGAGGMEWSGPAAYVKIRDGIYLGYWLEEACNGTLGTILINMNTMHDCGAGYHGGADGVRLTAVGAHSRHAGQFNVRKFFQL
jgi:hypothetical protein